MPLLKWFLSRLSEPGFSGFLDCQDKMSELGNVSDRIADGETPSLRYSLGNELPKYLFNLHEVCATQERHYISE